MINVLCKVCGGHYNEDFMVDTTTCQICWNKMKEPNYSQPDSNIAGVDKAKLMQAICEYMKTSAPEKLNIQVKFDPRNATGFTVDIEETKNYHTAFDNAGHVVTPF